MLGAVQEYIFSTIVLLFCLTPALNAQECGYDVNATREDTTLTSPGYPSNYLNNMDCTYRIMAPEGQRVYLTTSSIDGIRVEKSDFCTKDYILVIDGPLPNGQIITRSCEFPVSVLSTGRYLTVTFHSDGENTARGFRLFHRTIDSQEACPVQTVNAFDADSAILSPSFPMNYPNNTDCEWRIVAPEEYIVYIEVDQSALEQSEDCEKDYVRVYEAAYKGGGFTLDTWCGSEVPAPIYSPTIFMTIVFHSDGQVSDKGFRIVYSARPKSEFPKTPEKTDRRLVIGVTAGVIAAVVVLMVVGVFCVIRNRKSRGSNVTY